MTVALPALAGTWLAEPRPGGLLVLGPSLGTAAAQLWQPVVDHLDVEALDVGVLAWDLPGHASTPTGGPFDVSDLASAVLALVDALDGPDRSFAYAGDSVGGAVGLHLLLDHPGRVTTATLMSTGARIGDADGWRDRAVTVRAGGTEEMVEGSMQRWFSAHTRATHPALLRDTSRTLRAVDAEGYAQVCEALASYDVRCRLSAITVPVLAVAGREDAPTPPAGLAHIADTVADGRLVVLDDVAHLPPIEAPETVAALLVEHLRRPGES